MMSIDKMKEDEATLIVQEDFLDYAISHGFGDLHFKVDCKTGMKAIIRINVGVRIVPSSQQRATPGRGLR